MPCQFPPHHLPPDRFSKVSDRDPTHPLHSGRLENAIKKDDEMSWHLIRSVKKIDGDTKRVHLDGSPQRDRERAADSKDIYTRSRRDRRQSWLRGEHHRGLAGFKKVPLTAAGRTDGDELRRC